MAVTKGLRKYDPRKRNKMIRRKVKPKKKIKAVDVARNNIKPLTSKNELQRSRKEQNALNRSRSKAMENRVAKVLHGRRVLLSGAASAYKGDVEVRFENYPGGYIVECKLSSMVLNKEPLIYMIFEWFPKIHEEAKNMNAKFGIVVINFLGNTRDYVFIRKDIVDLLIHRYHSPYGDALYTLFTTAPVIDISHTKTGKIKGMCQVFRKDLESNMTTVDSISGMRLIVPDGEYLVLHIDTFARITKHM